MYLRILNVTFLCTFICHLAVCESNRTEDPTTGILLHFGEVYGQQIRTGLNEIGRLILTDKRFFFNKSGLAGTVKLDKGYLGMNLNINHLPDKFHKDKISPLPEGVTDGFNAVYEYLVKRIRIVYHYDVELVGSKDMSGYLNIILNNQIFEAKVEATMNKDGKCHAVDRGLNTTLDKKNYLLIYSLDDGDATSDDLLFRSIKVINTYMVTTVIKEIYHYVREKLIEIAEAPEEKSGINFPKQMELCLCHLDT